MYYFIYHIFNELPSSLDDSYKTWDYMHVSYSSSFIRRLDTCHDLVMSQSCVVPAAEDFKSSTIF